LERDAVYFSSTIRGMYCFHVQSMPTLGVEMFVASVVKCLPVRTTSHPSKRQPLQWMAAELQMSTLLWFTEF